MNKRVHVAIAALSAIVFGAIVMAQAPSSDADAHVAAARAAAGMDYRNTFMNLCLPGGGGPGGARGAAGPGRGAAAGQAAPARGAAAGQAAAGQAAPGRAGGGRGGGAAQTPDRAGW